MQANVSDNTLKSSEIGKRLKRFQGGNSWNKTFKDKIGTLGDFCSSNKFFRVVHGDSIEYMKNERNSATNSSNRNRNKTGKGIERRNGNDNSSNNNSTNNKMTDNKSHWFVFDGGNIEAVFFDEIEESVKGEEFCPYILVYRRAKLAKPEPWPPRIEDFTNTLIGACKNNCEVSLS